MNEFGTIACLTYYPINYYRYLSNMNWYQADKDEVLRELNTGTKGLSDDEVRKRREEYGPNELQAAKQRSRMAIFLSQFKDVMILILAAAAIVSFVAGETTDAIVILTIIIVNAVIGYYQEYNAEKSIRMLQQMAAQHSLVLRGGTTQEIDAADLVPGDIIILEAGNIVPADARLIESASLKAEEAALTGESESIHKTTDALTGEDLLPADQENMVFKGTIISNGTGKAVVTATGMNTEMGKIAGMLDIEQQKTPLQQRLAKFSKQLAVIVILICAVVFGFGLLKGEPPLKMFLTALSLAVAALPEALLVVVTIGLAQGAKRMVKQKALIRKLPAVETLGSVTYICSDKTGTLTLNKMTVANTEAAEGKEELLLHAMMLNNEVKENNHDELIGDSTEIAMVNYAGEKGNTHTKSSMAYPIVDTLPFDSDRMMMSTLHREGDKLLLLVKGAPGKIVEKLSGKYSEADKEKWLNQNRDWAAAGQRVLFFAYKYLQGDGEKIAHETESELEMLGAVGMIDPPREEVIAAIEECKTAGIRPVMITGDQPVTAMAIAKELNIARDADSILTGADIKKLGEKELLEKVKHTSVYARVSPGQKLEIVKALQLNGEYAAMTGDGVNDAPSLKQANIGIAMGITGTDVSKEAAHMILLDDNFATIVKAVKEGRRIYDNIRKFVLYILSCNLAEILTIVCAPLLGLPIPLLPIHILWINLVTDGLPGIALATEPAEKDIMKRPPRKPEESLFAGGMLYQVCFTGMILAAGALTAQYWAAAHGYDERAQQTLVFTVLCFSQLANALSVRSVYRPIFSVRLLANPLLIGSVLLTILLQAGLVYIPALHPVFKTVSLDNSLLLEIMIIPATCLLLIELIKLLYYKVFYSRQLKVSSASS